MLKRTIFGALYVAVIIAGILCGQFIFLLLTLLLTTLAINEFLIMVNPPLSNPQDNGVALLLRSLDCVGGALLAVTLWTGFLFLPGIITYIFYVFIRLIVQLWIVNQNPLHSLANSMLSQLYIALPLSLMSIIYRISPNLLLLLFILVWVNDTFAYLSGMTFGRHKLWVRISPKKTWEGLWGGIVMTIVVSTCCGLFAGANFGNISPWIMAGLGLIVGVVATLGDLVESLIKRTIGVKDSGTLIPGHGGILDRIDSILFVIPASLIYLFFTLFANAF